MSGCMGMPHETPNMPLGSFFHKKTRCCENEKILLKFDGTGCRSEV